VQNIDGLKKDLEMKKISYALIAASVLLSTSANAEKLGFGVDQGFGVVAQFDNINAFVGNDGASADFIFNRGSFSSDVPFDWYVGAGAFVGWDDGIGVRMPFGIRMNFTPKWDTFFQIHPLLDFDDGKNSDTKFSVDASIGVRYEF
jgi:hypothetical protein